MHDEDALHDSVGYTVESAETVFKRCWSTLIALQEGEKNNQLDFVSRFASFQPGLGDALFGLQNLKRIVATIRRDTVSQKGQLSYGVLRKRLHTLRKYQKILEDTSDIGRALGDSFAWIFYSNEQSLIQRHQAHPRIGAISTGTGGRAEIEFIRQFPKFGDYIVLWHSMTSFLRIGDFSLIDPHTAKVVSIGELKSSRQADGMTVQLILDNTKLRPEFLPQPSIVHKTPTNDARPILNDRGKARLQRQIKEMKRIFCPKTPSTSLTTESVNVSYLFNELADLFADLDQKAMVPRKVDRGLAFVGFRHPDVKLFERLRREKHPPTLDECMPVFKSIVDKTIPNNQLRLSSLGFQAPLPYELPLGARPVFWWHLRTEINKALLFREVEVLSAYNPAFLLHKLTSAGMRPTIDGRRITISKPHHSGDITFPQFQLLLVLIQSHLFPESGVVSMMTNLFDRLSLLPLTSRTLVQLNLNFSYQ